jgi:hypothetical protein
MYLDNPFSSQSQANTTQLLLKLEQSQTIRNRKRDILVMRSRQDIRANVLSTTIRNIEYKPPTRNIESPPQLSRKTPATLRHNTPRNPPSASDDGDGTFPHPCPVRG